ncbi:MAG TPA: cysteine desulfurase NifS [Candidatus Moranbacteria bacterium]|nr:cysteine desulfurase NifS [Candidatus Moranbacteria bacterium]HBT45899.1 cysteine desulfurase NifS [Candidatus Moranbacteria bacterium]
MKKIYLDYAATTPVDNKVLEKMLPYFSQNFGNAMSVHSFGQEALEAVDEARAKAALFFRASASEIIFTSGATESNNLVVKGSLRSYYSAPRRAGEKPHIITTKFEHHCVLDACKFAEKDGLADVTFVAPNKEGLISIKDIKAAIKPNTILISVMYVNNEIGTVQPIAEIGKLLKKINAERLEKKMPHITFHTDATQAINYFNCDVDELGVDLLSMSAHKIYGPKGIGLLYVRKGTLIKRVQDGGDQEFRLRAGTHNVPAIVGLGEAINMIKTPATQKNIIEITKLRDYLIKRVLKEIPKSYLNGSSEKRSPNNANFRFDDVEGEGLILSLDLDGIAASTGSACSSGALDPSHVLLSLGLKHEQAHGSLRLTLGKHTTKKELDIVIEKIKEVVKRLRKISGNVLADFQ